MKRTLLPLNALRVFDAAARHLSFTRAADELAVTPAAVGQQIRALEDTLGVVLFRRTARNLELTPEAERALPSVRAGFLAFEESVQQLQAWQGSRKLTIAAPRDLTALWLIQRLAAYRRERPDVSLSLVTADEPPDFAQTNVDLAVIYGTEPDPAVLRSSSVGAPGRVAVGAPPGGGGEDAEAIIVHKRAPSVADQVPPAGQAAVEVDDAGLALEAAAAGLGIAYVPALLAARHVGEGRVIERRDVDAPPSATDGLRYWLAAPEPQWRQAKVKAVVAFLTGS